MTPFAQEKPGLAKGQAKHVVDIIASIIISLIFAF
jgi:hypothetical protein